MHFWKTRHAVSGEGSKQGKERKWENPWSISRYLRGRWYNNINVLWCDQWWLYPAKLICFFFLYKNPTRKCILPVLSASASEYLNFPDYPGTIFKHLVLLLLAPKSPLNCTLICIRLLSSWNLKSTKMMTVPTLFILGSSPSNQDNTSLPIINDWYGYLSYNFKISTL